MNSNIAYIVLAVSRYELKSDLYEFYALLDVNIEVYPLKVRSPSMSTASACLLFTVT